ncbi:MAG: hypothetical protein ABS76_04495 [Pelagibacterium sp. SCN 64-44]|nr:MAG: hypothetical protein ABS76_04495 [Pelagibacterium sp. SCN 64-44]
MNPWSAIKDAALGWRMIILGQPEWTAQFNRTASGLAVALAVFAFAAFLAVIVASAHIGMPGLIGVVVAMLVLGLPLLALAIMVWVTRRTMRDAGPVQDVMVPGTYAATAFLLVEGLLALTGGPLVMLAWAGLAYLLFRLARMATNWHVVVAIAFAVLSVVLLVALRLALYMVSNLPTPD